MIKVIADGTINGWNIFPKNASANSGGEIFDIRTIFENGQGLLSIKPGYLIRPVQNGVWVSIVKLMMDGERSGGGNGYMSFSVFLQNGESLPKGEMKQALDGLMRHYLTKCTDGILTRATGVDWSFVDETTNALNGKVSGKGFDVNSSSNREGVALVNLGANPIDKYLDNPFQPEYMKFKTVVLSGELLSKAIVASCAPITIDFENITYKVEYSFGSDVKVSPNLNKVTKNELRKGKTVELTRKYYEPQTIELSKCEKVEHLRIIKVKAETWIEAEYVFNVQYIDPSGQSIVHNTTYKLKGNEVEKDLDIEGFVDESYRYMPCAGERVCPARFMDDMTYTRRLTPAKIVKITISMDGDDVTKAFSNTLQITGKGCRLLPELKSSLLVPKDSKVSDYVFKLGGSYKCIKKVDDGSNNWTIIIAPIGVSDTGDEDSIYQSRRNEEGGGSVSGGTTEAGGGTGYTPPVPKTGFWAKYKMFVIIGVVTLLLAGGGVGLYFYLNQDEEPTMDAEVREYLQGNELLPEILDAYYANQDSIVERKLVDTLKYYKNLRAFIDGENDDFTLDARSYCYPDDEEFVSLLKAQPGIVDSLRDCYGDDIEETEWGVLIAKAEKYRSAESEEEAPDEDPVEEPIVADASKASSEGGGSRASSGSAGSKQDKYNELMAVFNQQVSKWNITNLTNECNKYSISTLDARSANIYRRLLWLRDTRKRVENGSWGALKDFYTDSPTNPRWTELDVESKNSLSDIVPFITDLCNHTTDNSTKVVDFRNKCKQHSYAKKTLKQIKAEWENAKNNQDSSQSASEGGM